jgi:hypothetical protein
LARRCARGTLRTFGCNGVSCALRTCATLRDWARLLAVLAMEYALPLDFPATRKPAECYTRTHTRMVKCRTAPAGTRLGNMRRTQNL